MRYHITKKFLETEHYVNYKTLKQIAIENNISRNSICGIAKRLGIKRRSKKEILDSLLLKEIPSKEILYQKYMVENKTIKQIAKELNQYYSVIRTGLRIYNIIPHRGNKSITKEILEELYLNQHKTRQEIGEIFRLSESRIYDKLKEFNIPIPDQKGVSHWNYKDGKTLKVVYCKCGKQLGKLAFYNGDTKCGSCASKESFKIYGPAKHKSDCQCVRCKTERGEHSGENHWNWQNGKTPLKVILYQLPEAKQWRKAIFERDKYTCQHCNEVGGRLHAHHKKQFAIILQEFLQQYSQFSLIEDKETLVRLAMTYSPFWDINNGITLCKDCHGKIKHINIFTINKSKK